MNTADMDALAEIVRLRSGLALSADKAYLVESRLTPLARRHGFERLADLLEVLRRGAPEALLADVTEAMTTNESFFFRDKTPFDLFAERMLPSLIAARGAGQSVRIWCAASSTGQEPYSLAMTLREKGARLGALRAEIIATDISRAVLERAKAGVYTKFEVQRGLPIQLLVKYFEQAGDDWRLKPEIRQMVQFRAFNLLTPFTPLGRFDIIFCRNVLIYFDRPTKADVLERMRQALAPDGYLVLGAAETVLGITEAFEPVPEARGLYRPVAGERKAASSAPPRAAASAR
ncbi:MAG: protein-glutamate O-methyltransferase CheR [Alphaproteobacteria bacterium]|nr:protein-glutamate O-methyltransferase CheR [Alphaproteobacteria bacterium]